MQQAPALATKMATLSLKISVVGKNLIKTMCFEPSMMVFDVCRLIRDHLSELGIPLPPGNGELLPLDMSYFPLIWITGLWYELLDFDVSYWPLMWVTDLGCELLPFDMSYCPLMWITGLWYELLDFDVSYWTLMWVTALWCELLPFDVSYWPWMWVTDLGCE